MRKDKIRISVNCELCREPQCISQYAYEKTLAKSGLYRCKLCGIRVCWTDPERFKKRGLAIKQSQLYQDAVRRIDRTGPKNGMWGKRASDETRRLMSEARKGKTGPNATGWKGGRTSFTKRVKGLLTTRIGWYAAVFKRDNSTCRCGATKDLDAHHIEPIVKIIKRITRELTFSSEEEKLEFVISHPGIVDQSLSNGITLCRACHRKAHSNWGSHVEP